MEGGREFLLISIGDIEGTTPWLFNYEVLSFPGSRVDGVSPLPFSYRSSQKPIQPFLTYSGNLVRQDAGLCIGTQGYREGRLLEFKHIRIASRVGRLLKVVWKGGGL